MQRNELHEPMTVSGERNALEPVQTRLRALLAQHPRGPLPDTALNEIRTAATFRSSPPSPPASRDERRARREAARTELVELLRSADTAPSGLERLSADLRSSEGPFSGTSSLEAGELGAPPDRLRAIAAHLLDTGVTGAEIRIGLNLYALTPREGDGERVRLFAPLGRMIGAAAIEAISAGPRPGPHLAWVAERTPPCRRDRAIEALLEPELTALLDDLSTADAAGVVQMFSAAVTKPEWFDGDRRLARLLRDAAWPGAIGFHPYDLGIAAQLWDDVRYGRCALLGFGSGEREATAEGFRTILTAPEAASVVEAALTTDPGDHDLIWLRMQLDRAAGADTGPLPRGLAVRVTVPIPSSAADPRTHLLVNGDPVVERHFRRGFPETPEHMMHREGGLRALSEPRDVRLGDTGCVEECCGAFRATIRRDGDQVEWQTRDTGRPGEGLARFAFDAAQYDAEIGSAAIDFEWEWPARRAARFLRERLAAEPDLLGRWQCELAWTESWSVQRSTLRYSFCFPQRPSVSENEPWLQFTATFDVPYGPIDDGSVAADVDLIAAGLRTTDPKSTAAVTGGSPEHARALGYDWPIPGRRT